MSNIINVEDTIKNYIVLVTADCNLLLEKPTLSSKTYIIDKTSDENEYVLFSDNIEIHSKDANEQVKEINTNIQDMCKWILDNIPIEKVSEIVVETFGFGTAFFNEIKMLIQNNNIGIILKEIRGIKNFNNPFDDIQK